MTERRRGQRKDRLIQTRVPQDLESTLKDEARKRRLSVSHLIRNVLEDTFNLVDNVVVEVDKVVNDSVEMAQTFKRDAVRLAQTVQGSTAHREDGSGEVVETEAETEESEATAADAAQADAAQAQATATDSAQAQATATDAAQTDAAQTQATATDAAQIGPPVDEPSTAPEEVDLSSVYAWQPVVINRPTVCAKCRKALAKGDHGHMGLTGEPGPPKFWLCDECVEAL